MEPRILHTRLAALAIGVAVALCAIVAVCLLKLLRLAPDTGTLLESMAMAGACGIGIGRLASLFDTSCRGLILKDGKVEFVFDS